jgi:hypothetical protein
LEAASSATLFGIWNNEMALADMTDAPSLNCCTPFELQSFVSPSAELTWSRVISKLFCFVSTI